MCTSPLPAMPHVKSGRLRALAMTGAERVRAPRRTFRPWPKPFPGYESTLWYALLAPAGTPPAIVKRLHDETVKIVKSAGRDRTAARRRARNPSATVRRSFEKFIRTEIDALDQGDRGSNAQIDPIRRVSQAREWL